jgi:hypothetical protein
MFTTVRDAKSIVLLSGSEPDRVSLSLPLAHDIIQLVEHLLSLKFVNEKPCKVTVQDALWCALNTQEQHTSNQVPGLSKRLILSPHLHDSSFGLSDINLYQRVVVEQNVEIMNLRIQLDAALKARREIELQTRHAHEQSQLAHQERERELQVTLDETRSNAKRTVISFNDEIEQLHRNQASLEQELDKSRAHFAQTQAEFQQRESDLRAALNDTLCNSEKAKEALNSEIGRLHKNHSLLNQSLEEKLKLLDQMNSDYQQRESNLQAALDEANRSAIERLEYSKAECAQQIQSLVEQGLRLEKELAESEQSRKFAVVERENTISSLRDQLNWTRHTVKELGRSRQQLVEKLRQTKLKSRAQEEQIKQAIDAQKPHSSEDNPHFQEVIEGLNEQLERYRNKAKKLYKILIQHKQLLTREHQIRNHLQNLLKTKEKDAVILKESLTKAEHDLMEQSAELQQLTDDYQLAWRKSSDSELALQMAKLEISSVKHELEHDNANLRAQLEQIEEARKLLSSRHAEEMERLRRSLQEQHAAQIRTLASVDTLKNERQVLLEEKSDLEKQLEQLKKDSNAQMIALNTAIKSDRDEIILLRHKLVAANTNTEEFVEFQKQRQLLQLAKEEIEKLHFELDELRQIRLGLEKRPKRAKYKKIHKSLNRTESESKVSSTRRLKGSVFHFRRQVKKSTLIKNHNYRFRLRIQCKNEL